MDRIAQTAGCNKNLIYVYFENKETLFTTVLDLHLSRVYSELPITPDDLPGYAVRIFDFTMANPELTRLVAWSNLEAQALEPSERAKVHGSKVTDLAAAQSNGSLSPALSADFLLTAVMTLATAYTAANPFGPNSTADPDAVRENIATAVRLLTEPS